MNTAVITQQNKTIRQTPEQNLLSIRAIPPWLGLWLHRGTNDTSMDKNHMS